MKVNREMVRQSSNSLQPLMIEKVSKWRTLNEHFGSSRLTTSTLRCRALTVGKSCVQQRATCEARGSECKYFSTTPRCVCAAGSIQDICNCRSQRLHLRKQNIRRCGYLRNRCASQKCVTLLQSTGHLMCAKSCADLWTRNKGAAS